MTISREKVAYLFPGQGVQEADKLDQQSIQQAVVGLSCGLLVHAREFNPSLVSLKPNFYAGHSVGIWSAIYAAGMISGTDLQRAINKRASLMETVGSGKMAAIVGANWHDASDVWSSEGVSLAVINCPGQFVISGKESDVVRASAQAEKIKARVLNVKAAGPNHSYLMEAIQPAFRQYLQGLDLNEPNGLVVLNTSGLPVRSIEAIRAELTDHLSRTVQWEVSVRNMILSGTDKFVEWGSDTLSKFIKRIDPRIRTISITNYKQAAELTF